MCVNEKSHLRYSGNSSVAFSLYFVALATDKTSPSPQLLARHFSGVTSLYLTSCHAVSISVCWVPTGGLLGSYKVALFNNRLA